MVQEKASRFRRATASKVMLTSFEAFLPVLLSFPDALEEFMAGCQMLMFNHLMSFN